MPTKTTVIIPIYKVVAPFLKEATCHTCFSIAFHWSIYYSWQRFWFFYNYICHIWYGAILIRSMHVSRVKKVHYTWNAKEINYDIQNALMTCSHESVNVCKNYYFLWAPYTPVLDFCWRLLWVSKLEWAALFALGGGVRDVCSLRYTSSATPADLLTVNIAAGCFSLHVKFTT